MGKLNFLERKLFADKSVNSLQGPSTPSHWILWIACAFIFFFVVWACFGTLNEMVHASGKVIPSKKIKVMQFSEVARIKDIMVKEGQHVKKGDILIRIDDTMFESDFREGHSRALALKAKVARLDAENKGSQLQLSEDVSKEFPVLASYEAELFKSKRNQMLKDISILTSQKKRKLNVLSSLKKQEKQINHSFDLIKKELLMLKPLVEQGAASEIEVLRLQRTANDILGKSTLTNMHIQTTEHEIVELDYRIDALKAEKRTKMLGELAEAESKLSSIQESNIGLADRVDKTTIRAPVDGIVKQIYVTTIGEVISPDVDLIEIVPDDDSLLIEAYVKPADIAFLKIGQPVMVKITAYDFTIYGSFKGKLEHISADTTTNNQGESFYEIWVRTSKNYLLDKNTNEKLVIKVGMDANISIQTGEKTVMSYILKPVLKTKGSALSER